MFPCALSSLLLQLDDFSTDERNQLWAAARCLRQGRRRLDDHVPPHGEVITSFKIRRPVLLSTLRNLD